MAAKKVIETLRKEIDTADRELLSALGKRMKLVDKVALYKKSQNLRPLDPKRWKEVLRSRVQHGKTLKLSPDFVKSMYETIHREALKIERKRIRP